jgi:hypothetical protein
MVVHSPELFGDASVVAQASVDVAEETQTLESVFFLLAALGCLGVLAHTSENLSEHCDIAFRKELGGSLGLGLFLKSRALWSGFDRFAESTIASLNPAERDRLQVEFALSHISIAQLFDPSATWPSLQKLGAARFQKLVSARGGVVAVQELLRLSYRRQRDALARELLLKALPTAVLWLAGLVAIAMALSFTRSLVSG